MDNSQISDFIQKRSLVQSLLPHIEQVVIEETLIENDLDVDLAVNQLLSTDADTFSQENYAADKNLIKDLESLDITSDFASEKTAYWINLFPQLSYDQIKNVIKQNLHEPEEVILSALEATSVVLLDQLDVDTPENNSKDTKLINDLILFEHHPKDIIENELLMGDYEDIDDEAITQMKASILKKFISLDNNKIVEILEEHRYHIGQTIVSIIVKSKYKNGDSSSLVSNSKIKGIVQRSNRGNNVKLVDPFNQSLKRSSPQPTNFFNVNLKSEKLINYYDDKITTLLVKTIINYYEGNETKSLNLIDYLEQNEYIDETVKLLEIFDKDNKLDFYTLVGPNSLHESQKPKVLPHTYKASIKKPRIIKHVSANKKRGKHSQLDIDYSDNIEKAPTVIDLHGQTVASALMTISKSLKNWWQMELNLRGNSATQAQQARSLKALYAGPLNIITGKGLHSKQGVSRIKIQCRTYLRLNSYTFEEGDGFFTVTGRSAVMYK